MPKRCYDFVFLDRRLSLYPLGRKQRLEGNPGSVGKGMDSGQLIAPNIHPVALGNGFPSGPSGRDYFSWNSLLLYFFPFQFALDTQ